MVRHAGFKSRPAQTKRKEHDMEGFICGLMVGVILTVIVMSLVNSGARADECAECQERQNRYMAAVRAGREDTDEST